MDLNYLYFRHKISLMRAAAATNQPARLAHKALAALYAARIADLERSRRTVRAA